MVHKYQEAIQPLKRFTNMDLNVLQNIQSLWSQYMMWSRSNLLSIVFNSPNLESTQTRLYRVPIDFYNTLRVFAGDRFAQLFLNYIQRRIIIEQNLYNAMSTNNINAINAYTQQLYENADEFSAFLSQSPYWNEAQWRSFLYQDISMSIEQVRALLSGEYEREIGVYERILLNAVDIGNYMANGLFEFTA